ncbi:MAG: M23 family metallopeptidase [Azoarcus sp.]|jgi:murein DD-endopeptidase MepM/ murein hydrolase activator NlpD|nr:M23 family metallopeptidase [Azoarcus sp.]
MRIRKTRILAELRWRLSELRWRLATLPRRSTRLRLADLRWHAGELRWRLAGSHRLNRLSRQMADLPWQLFDRKRLLIAGGFAGISVFGGVAATAVVVPADSVEMQTVVERLAVAPQELPAPSLPFVYDDTINPSDTLQSIFRRLGIADPEALAFVQNKKEVTRALRQLRSGASFTAIVDVSGRLLSLCLPLASSDGYLEVARAALDKPLRIATVPNAALTAGVEMRTGVIKHSLFAATEAANLPDSVAAQLTDLFGTDIDFHADLQPGDTFSVIYETFYGDHGIPLRPGRILAAEFINQGKRYAVFRHTTSSGGSEYYSSTGQGLRSTFLRSPLEFTRITSSFGRRLHPVLGNWRNHQGVDFGAPIGTPVRAASDGVVSFIGTQGGYGNIVVLKHQNNVSTAYAHLSAFAPDLHIGDAVTQGENIGQVGATGRVSGPHLHYEFRINDVAQNPMTVALPGATPLTGKELARFRENTRPLLAQLALLNYRIAANDEKKNKL